MTKPRVSASTSTAPSEWISLKEQLIQFAAIVGIAAFVAFTGITLIEWQKRESLPFCDYYASESCIPCPENARCSGKNMECLFGFTKHGKRCLRDQKIRKAIEAIDELIIEKFCGNYSLSLCKWTGPKQLTVFEIAQFVEHSELDKVLGIDSENFKLVKEEGQDAAIKRLNTRKNSQGLLELYCPIQLVEYYKPYRCRAWEWMLSYRNILLISCPLVFLAVVILSKAYLKQKISKRAEQLYIQVCQTLEAKSQNNMTGGETWVVASHLRDHLLTLNERKNGTVWYKVEQMVRRDSRIDQYPKLVKGESKVVWEWQV
ncbi:hypothetical protein KP509_33G061300 [Ceratopteris richardii]|uniref:Man1/Src1-like C-terminal domain-containing protein n=2 Tax=Ceratopteris richardii TaxID=49495 RepID=A0A8T2QRS4_CERRI|nr:hypothetical protein KP509_33G061300 [Ceratopteris richardii]